MAYNEDYLTYIEDQLEGINNFQTKKMFGGIGFFNEGIMFGMIGGGVFRLKVDDTNRSEYEKLGMKAFLSTKMKKGLPYYEVPIDILEDKDKLKKWVEKSILVADNAKRKSKK